MATSPSPTIPHTVASHSLTSSSASASPTCDKDVMPELEWTVSAGYLQEGPVCAFPLAVPLNFINCCAAGQSVQTSGVCYQFYVVNQTDPSGMDDFSECVNWIAEAQNQSLGISGCKQKSSGTTQASMWRDR